MPEVQKSDSKVALVPLEEAKKRPVTDVQFPVDQKLLDDMFKLMEEKGGVGLAAPQIGLLKKLFIMKLGEQQYVVCNPTLYLHGKMFTLFKEGCLTVPGMVRQILRFESCRLTGFNEKGEPFDWNCKGLMARVIQHEVDHLNSVCIADHKPLNE